MSQSQRRATRRSTAENRITIESPDLKKNPDLEVKSILELATDPKEDLKAVKIADTKENDVSDGKSGEITEVDENNVEVAKEGILDGDVDGVIADEDEEEEEGAPEAKMPKLDDDEETNSSVEIQGAVKTKKEKVTFPCPECERKFLKKSFLTKHIKSHSAVRPFVCDEDQCDRSFIQLKSLLKHAKTVHRQEDLLHLCPFCQREFITRAEMECHAETHVSEFKMYACRYCGKTFSKKFTMKISIQASQEKIPDPCPFCNRAINAKAYSDK